MLYPFGKAVLYSFYRGLEDGRFVGLTNYFELFDNSMFHLAIENSLKFWLIALPLIILVPLLLAILFMNILTPYISKWTATKPLGGVKA